MTREEVKLEFTTHDHLMINKQQQDVRQNNLSTSALSSLTSQENLTTSPNLSTIAILRRNPMYDSLLLVKRYRACLNGYTLEFPTSAKNVTNDKHNTTTKDDVELDCSKTKLVSVYLDGDDPIYQCQERKNNVCDGLLSHDGEIVYVPMNGLLERLDNYDRHGVSIDSKVYAFAMGLKTAEKFLTTNLKEIQETPPL